MCCVSGCSCFVCFMIFTLFAFLFSLPFSLLISLELKLFSFSLNLQNIAQNHLKFSTYFNIAKILWSTKSNINDTRLSIWIHNEGIFFLYAITTDQIFQINIKNLSWALKKFASKKKNLSIFVGIMLHKKYMQSFPCQYWSTFSVYVSKILFNDFWFVSIFFFGKTNIRRKMMLKYCWWCVVLCYFILTILQEISVLDRVRLFVGFAGCLR